MEKRSWSTSGFIGGHHQNLAGAILCQVSIFRVPVVGGYHEAILECEGTCGSGKVCQNQQLRPITADLQYPWIPALSVTSFVTCCPLLRMHRGQVCEATTVQCALESYNVFNVFTLLCNKASLISKYFEHSLCIGIVDLTKHEARKMNKQNSYHTTIKEGI